MPAAAHMVLGRRIEPGALPGWSGSAPPGIRRLWRIVDRCDRIHTMPARRVTTPEPRKYVSVAGLSGRVQWSEHAIRRMVSRGTLKRGVHYHQPGGRRGKLMFDVDAIDEFIRREREPEPRRNPLTITMADGTEVILDEEDEA